MKYIVGESYMREIKFKLWYKPTKQMYYYKPAWGNYEHGSGWIGGVLLEDYLKKGRTFAPSNQMQLEPDSCDWMQFTGLFDKNGKEIYEGDIIQYEGEYFKETVSIVWYNTGSWGLHDREKSLGELIFSEVIRYDPFSGKPIYTEVEVIGNIYESPELLK